MKKIIFEPIFVILGPFFLLKRHFFKNEDRKRDFISTDNLKYILGDTEDFEKDVEGFCDRAGEFNYRKFARRLIEQRTIMKYAD